MRKTKIIFIFGTRPEAIKMAPLILEFQKNKDLFEIKICVTAQHREMLDQVLAFFEITPDCDLNLMKQSQNLFNLTSDILLKLKPVLEEFKPDYVFVHGDTTTSMSAALAAFYSGAKVCHVEAGLRTYNKLSPFPEEMNRQITSRIADLHFCPTTISSQNLIKENIPAENIFITGNTVIDALFFASKKVEKYENEEIDSLKSILDLKRNIILVTGHRRENFGEGFINICESLKEIAKIHSNFDIIYPVHLNPNVQKPVNDLLHNIKNIKLISPLSYPSFVWLMKRSLIILTDSGGIQEEAISLGKPVLVMRATTERPEGMQTGLIKLVGTNKNDIVSNTNRLIKEYSVKENKLPIKNPYGDGNAAKRIVKILKRITS